MWDARKPGSKPTQEYKSGGENFTLDYSPDGHYIAMGYVCTNLAALLHAVSMLCLTCHFISILVRTCGVLMN